MKEDKRRSNRIKKREQQKSRIKRLALHLNKLHLDSGLNKRKRLMTTKQMSASQLCKQNQIS